MSYFTIGFIVVVAFLASVLLTSVEIPILRKKQAGQNIREEGPKSHYAKAGTPSMGGIAMIGAVIAACAIGRYYSVNLAAVILVFLLFGAIGFFDDYLKVVKRITWVLELIRNSACRLSYRWPLPCIWPIIPETAHLFGFRLRILMWTLESGMFHLSRSSFWL